MSAEVNESSSIGDFPKHLEVSMKFIQRFRAAVNKEIVTTIEKLYKYISDTLEIYDPAAIAELVADDRLFLMLYEEIYNRLIHFSESPPTINQRISSFKNYQNLFDYILAEKATLKVELPDQFLWDIIEEFVIQYESFCHYRENLKDKIEEEIESLKANEKLWDFLYVVEILYKLIETAKDEMKAETPVPSTLIYIKLGHFAIYGLLRLSTVNAEYYNAIKILDDRRHFPTGMSLLAFSSLPGCQFSVVYHASFAYMMMQRYIDAINIAANTLEYFQDNMHLYLASTYQNNKIHVFVRKMLNILCISFVLHYIIDTENYTLLVEEIIFELFENNQCKPKITKMEEELKLQNHPQFESSFLDCCPEFVLPKAPGLEECHANYSKKATENQFRIFIEEIKYHDIIPSLKFELEMKSIPHKKIPLVRFLEKFMKIEGGIKHLLRAKHQQLTAVRLDDATSSGLDCTFHEAAEIDFLIYKDYLRVFIAGKPIDDED